MTHCASAPGWPGGREPLAPGRSELGSLGAARGLREVRGVRGARWGRGM